MKSKRKMLENVNELLFHFNNFPFHVVYQLDFTWIFAFNYIYNSRWLAIHYYNMEMLLILTSLTNLNLMVFLHWEEQRACVLWWD